jgi:3-oxoacyl-[acyl-carrier-protein] synthase II
MLAGGADCFSRITYTGFARLGAIARECCRPFDMNRQGMIPAEGAAVLLLERAETARARGARIYAEVAGYGLSCDAHHMTSAHPTGAGAVRAMELALTDAGIERRDVSYICAHGTGTRSNDLIEAKLSKPPRAPWRCGPTTSHPRSTSAIPTPSVTSTACRTSLAIWTCASP